MPSREGCSGAPEPGRAVGESVPQARPQRRQLATELAYLGAEAGELRSEIVSIVGRRGSPVGVVGSSPFLLTGPEAGRGTVSRIAVCGCHQRTVPPLLLLARPATEPRDQRFVERGQVSELAFHVVEAVELRHPVRAEAELADGLGPAEQEHGQQGPLAGDERQGLAEGLTVEFTIAPGRKGEEARNVRVVAA